jgi:hypothetical protein
MSDTKIDATAMNVVKPDPGAVGDGKTESKAAANKSKKRYRKEASQGWRNGSGRKKRQRKAAQADANGADSQRSMERSERSPAWDREAYKTVDNNKFFIPYYKAQNLMPEEVRNSCVRVCLCEW